MARLLGILNGKLEKEKGLESANFKIDWEQEVVRCQKRKTLSNEWNQDSIFINKQLFMLRLKNLIAKVAQRFLVSAQYFGVDHYSGW